MIININDYRREGNIKIIHTLYDRYKDQHMLTRVVNDISQALYCPVLVAYCLYGELYGFTEELLKGIVNVQKFYNVEIENMKISEEDQMRLNELRKIIIHANFSIRHIE